MIDVTGFILPLFYLSVKLYQRLRKEEYGHLEYVGDTVIWIERNKS